MTLHDLPHYGFSPERGFLSRHEIDGVALPAVFAEIEAAAVLLPDLLTTGRIRYWLDRLPPVDVGMFAATASPAELAVALVRYSFLAQAYVWGEEGPPRLPAALAVPLVALADALGMPPVMTYAGYVLDNWCRIDKAGPIVFENIAMNQHLAGGADETGFALTHVAIEAAAGPALDLAVDLVRASDRHEAWAVETMLNEMGAVWRSISGILDRIAERCDPAIYRARVQPYLRGCAGVIYEGVGRYAGQPVALRGQTGLQSSIVPAMEALFGTAQQPDGASAPLQEFDRYRPPAHRAFIKDLAAASKLRGFAAAQGGSLGDAFEAAGRAVVEFRDTYMRLVDGSYSNHSGSQIR